MTQINKVGVGLFATGICLLFAYGGYKILEELIQDTSVPLMIKIGFIAMFLGMLIVIIALILERMNDKKNNKDLV